MFSRGDVPEKIFSSSASSSDLHRVEHRGVAVDDGVHQRVEHVARAVAQQLRLALAARAHLREAALGVLPRREHVIAADEHVHLADLQLVARHLDGVQHGEDRIAVFLDLGTLVAVVGVLHRQRVQVELVLHLGQLGGVGVPQRHPDEAVRAADVGLDLALGDLGELLAVLVGDAIDQHLAES